MSTNFVSILKKLGRLGITIQLLTIKEVTENCSEVNSKNINFSDFVIFKGVITLQATHALSNRNRIF